AGGPSYRSPHEHLGGGLHLWYWSWSPVVEVTARDCVFENNYAEEAGGGVYSHRLDDLTLTGCRLIANGSRGHGGGLYVTFGCAQLVNCRFYRNSAGRQGGGGACQENDNVTLSNCTLTNNMAHSAGGGMAITGSPTKLFDCTFRDNRAEVSGGGIDLITEDSMEAVGCCFVSNRAGNRGGAIRSSIFDQVDLTHCLFCGNTAGDKGGGIWRILGELTMINCTAFGNRAAQGGTLFDETPRDTGTYTRGWASIRNSIIMGNGAQISNDFGLVSIEHTSLAGGQSAIADSSGFVVWGAGNTDADPCLADPGYWDPNGTPDDPQDDFSIAGDYHLKSQAGRWDEASGSWVQDDVTSPCIDAGDPNSPIMYEPFPSGGVVNMGAYGGTTQASKSYFGEPLCETIIAGDINGDCRVDLADIIILLDHWLQSGEKAEE
ncbi:MAG: right-handed parallel beta-helix repeat-containing protein, partial [Phycisphaerales bacterium]